MIYILLSFSNPLLIAMLVLAAGLSILLSQSGASLIGLVVAVAPMIALMLTTTWLGKISAVFKQAGAAFKNAVFLAFTLLLLNDDRYFQIISDASRVSTQSMPSVILELCVAVLSYAALMTLLVTLSGLLIEVFLRILAGDSGYSLSPVFESYRMILISASLLFAAKPLVGLAIDFFRNP